MQLTREVSEGTSFSFLYYKRFPFWKAFVDNAGFILPLRIASDTIL
jgi:hypothetical protein